MKFKVKTIPTPTPEFEERDYKLEYFVEYEWCNNDFRFLAAFESRQIAQWFVEQRKKDSPMINYIIREAIERKTN